MTIRAVVGAAPFVGPAMAELITTFIPNQKLHRLQLWIDEFATRVAGMEGGIQKLEERLQTEEGADIMEDGLLASARAITAARRQYLSNLIAHGFAAESFDHDLLKTLTRLLGELTDAEIVVLTFYANIPTFGSAWHKAMMERHPNVLMPISRELGLPEEIKDQAVLQDHRKETLARLNLLDLSDKTPRITALGRLLVGHIVDPQLLAEEP